jgi:hypothetical protein
MTTVAAGSAIAITVRPAQQTSLFHHSRSFQLAPAAAFKAPHHSSSSSVVAVVVVQEQSSRSSLQVRSGRVYSCCSKNFLFLPSLPDAFRGATRQRLTAAARPNSEAIRAAGDSSGMEADQEQEAQQQQQEKWTGGVELTLSCPVESAWAVQSDFLGLHKWAPNILLCELVEGENKKVGCLRHCVGTGTTWVHERLLQFDDDNMYMSYRMEQNHFIFPKGFQGYHSTVQVHNSCSPHPPPPPFFILDLQFLRFFSFLQTSKSLQLFANFQVSSAFSNFPIFFSFLQLPSFFSFLQLSSFFSFLKLMSSSFSSNFFSSSSLFLFVLLLISRSRTKLVSKCGTKFTLQLEVCNYTKLLCIIIHDWIGIRESPFLFSGCK